MNKAQIFNFFSRLAEANPAPQTELEYGNDYQLLVAVVLSAQATDVGVNKATRALFRDVLTPQQMVDLGEEGLKQHIKTIGLFNAKAKNVIALSDILVRDFDGQVPQDRDTLTTLPDRQCRGQHRLRSGSVRRRHAYLPRRQPHGLGARQDRPRGRAEAGQARARSLSPRCASLADPARTLCV